MHSWAPVEKTGAHPRGSSVLAGGNEREEKTMRTAEAVRWYLEGVEYPADPERLLVAAEANDATQDFLELLGLLPTMPTPAEFYEPDEVAEQLERLKGPG